MANTPFFSPVAGSMPYQPDISRLGTFDVQSAIDKLAWLMSISDMVDEDGNFVIRLGPPVPQVVLSAEYGESIYLLSASNNGELITDSAFISPATPQNYRIYRKPNGTLVRLAVAEDGTVLVVDADPDPYSRPAGKVFLKSPDNTVWILGVTNNNEIVLESGQAFNNWFKIINQTNQLLFGVNTEGFLGLNHLPVFLKEDLPPAPELQANSLPWAFLADSRGNKVPVYFDGAVWRYFSNNGAV